jgi:hypothetical protein
MSQSIIPRGKSKRAARMAAAQAVPAVFGLISLIGFVSALAGYLSA